MAQLKYRYKIMQDHHLIIDRFEGKMNLYDMARSLETCTKDPQFRTSQNVLSDMSRVDPEFGIDQIRSWAGFLSPNPLLKYGKVAIVAPKSLQFGLFRMMGLVSETADIYDEFHVYSSFDEAKSWLELPADLNVDI